MANTQSLTIQKSNTDSWAIARLDYRKLFINLPRIVTHPNIRPPVLDEMMPDIERTIHKLAHLHHDHTCPNLQFDELVAEGRLKLVQLLNKGILERQLTRTNFFKFLKASVNNQFRSLVQKHRFTHKRTGQKPPPRLKPGEVPPIDFEPEVHRKQVEVSLDDEEANVQVPDTGHNPQDEKELIEEHLRLLNKVERLVYMELINPDVETLLYAEEDAIIGHDRESVKIKITDKHRAAGIGFEELGIGEEAFKKAVLSIRRKIRKFMDTTSDDKAQYNARVQQLSQIFGVQVPHSVGETVLRRLFTIAGIHQSHKVQDNPQVRELLEEIGAKVPRIYNDKMSCYGIFYQRANKQCAMCGLRQSCATEVANTGLDKITISPRLLGAKMVRLPAIFPAISNQPQPASVVASDEMEIISYLNETFTECERNGQSFYIHRPLQDRGSKKRKLLFCLESRHPIRLRFCNPGYCLKDILIGKQKTWYAPDGLTVAELIDLIDQHAKESFESEYLQLTALQLTAGTDA